MKTLHYDGTAPVYFVTGNVGKVDPGEDFEVHDALLDRFVQRGDVSDPSDPDGRKAERRRKQRAARKQRSRRSASSVRAALPAPSGEDDDQDGDGDAQPPDGSPQSHQDATSETERGI